MPACESELLTMPLSTLNGPKSVATAAVDTSSVVQLPEIFRLRTATAAMGKSGSVAPNLSGAVSCPFVVPGRHQDRSLTNASTNQGRVIRIRQNSKAIETLGVVVGLVGACATRYSFIMRRCGRLSVRNWLCTASCSANVLTAG